MDIIGPVQTFVLLILGIGALCLTGFAAVDALRYRSQLYPAIGRQTKIFWVADPGRCLPDRHRVVLERPRLPQRDRRGCCRSLPGRRASQAQGRGRRPRVDRLQPLLRTAGQPWPRRRTAAPRGSSWRTSPCASGTPPSWTARRTASCWTGPRSTPAAGGQPPDHGTLLWGGVQTRIVGARRGDDLVLVPADGRPGAADRHRGPRGRRGRATYGTDAHPLRAAPALRRRLPRLRLAGDGRQHGAARGPDGLQPPRGAGGLQGAGRRGVRRRGRRRPGDRGRVTAS